MFGLRLSPMGQEDLLADASGAALAALRAGLVGMGGSDATTAGGAAATAGDRVFISSMFTYATGVYTAVSDSSPLNTLGKTLNSSEAVVNSLSAAGAGARRQLRLELQAPPQQVWPQQQQPLQLQLLPLHQQPRRRSLGLALPPLNTSALTPDASNPGSYYTFAILSPSQSSAEALKSALLSGSVPSALASALALVSAATGGPPIAPVLDRASVAVVTLTFTATYWSLLWDYFARNITAVLAAGCVLAAVVCLGACLRAFYMGGVARAKDKRGRQCWPTVYPARYLRRKDVVEAAKLGIPGYLLWGKGGAGGGGSAAGEEGGIGGTGGTGAATFSGLTSHLKRRMDSAQDAFFSSMSTARAKTQMRNSLALILSPDKAWERTLARRRGGADGEEGGEGPSQQQQHQPPLRRHPLPGSTAALSSSQLGNYQLDLGLNLDYGRASLDPAASGGGRQGSILGGGESSFFNGTAGTFHSPSASARGGSILKAELALPQFGGPSSMGGTAGHRVSFPPDDALDGLLRDARGGGRSRLQGGGRLTSAGSDSARVAPLSGSGSSPEKNLNFQARSLLVLPPGQ